MGKKQEYNKQMKQLAIMRAAEEIFLQKPYSSITVNEIAASAGVTKRTVYSYYPSKLALFVQMFDKYLQQLHKQILSAAQEDLTPDRRLFRVLQVQISFTRENEAFMRLFWTLDSDEFGGELPQELAQSIRLWNRDMIDIGIRIIQEGQARGLVIARDPELLIHLMSAFVKGLIFHTNKEARLSIAKVDPQQLQDLFLELISKVLLTDPSARTGSGVTDAPGSNEAR